MANLSIRKLLSEDFNSLEAGVSMLDILDALETRLNARVSPVDESVDEE